MFMTLMMFMLIFRMIFQYSIRDAWIAAANMVLIASSDAFNTLLEMLLCTPLPSISWGRSLLSILY